jgi:hypothetical protein
MPKKKLEEKLANTARFRYPAQIRSAANHVSRIRTARLLAKNGAKNVSTTLRLRLQGEAEESRKASTLAELDAIFGVNPKGKK